MPDINILVVDDEKEIADLIEIYLVSDGYKVFKAENAEAGLSILDKQDIHLVLLDIMMPVMNGLEASRQIRSLSRPDGNMIPILAMTAQDAISVSSQCRQYGMDDYVLKPADPEQLTKMILKYVKTI